MLKEINIYTVVGFYIFRYFYVNYIQHRNILTELFGLYLKYIKFLLPYLIAVKIFLSIIGYS